VTDNGSGKKWRWFVAAQLNKRRNQCWADLVMWALNWNPKEHRPWAPSSPIRSMCRRDAALNGNCYCNKINASEGRP
jgi:hypothetical protein